MSAVTPWKLADIANQAFLVLSRLSFFNGEPVCCCICSYSGLLCAPWAQMYDLDTRMAREALVFYGAVIDVHSEKKKDFEELWGKHS